VFATKKRQSILRPGAKEEFYRYCAGLVRDFNCFFQCMGGVEDHIHLLVGLDPVLSVSEFAQKFKANTSRLINSKGWVIGKFEWQSGFGAFSVSRSGLERVRQYLSRQDEHHKSKSFMMEYEAMLTKHQVAYSKEYIFVEPSD
jgi:REP element-mobilizing transposase RayT